MTHTPSAVFPANRRRSKLDNGTSKTRSSTWKILRIGGLILILLLLAIGILLLFNLNIVRPYINKKVSTATGRAFVIHGDMYFKFRWPPMIEANDIEMGNAPWSSEERMFVIPTAHFSVNPYQLLMGRLVLPEVSFSQAQVLLEKNEEGKANWKFGSGEPGGKTVLPDIGRVSIDRGALRYRDPGTKTDILLHLSTTTTEDKKPALKIDAQGKYKDMNVSADGVGGALLTILDETRPYPINAEVKIGGTKASMRGSITGLTSMSAMDSDITIEGSTMASLFPLLGITLPQTRPYMIKGQLIHTGDTWKLLKFSGKVGASDLRGDFEVTIKAPRPLINVEAVSNLLDLEDLSGFVGNAPETQGSGDIEAEKQKAARAQQKASSKVLPKSQWRLNRLRAVDAHFILDGKSIRGIKNPLDNLKMNFKLEDGVVTLEPLNFGIADGNIISSVQLNAQQEVIHSSADFEFRKIRLAKLMPSGKTIEDAAGIIGGRAKLTGTGNSMADLLATANGQIGIASTGGKISELLVQILQLHVGDAIPLLLAGDKDASLRCAAGQFKVVKGAMQTEFFIVDTSASTIIAEGDINLAKERLDLTVNPESKKPAVLSGSTPIRITGRFKDPSIYPDPKGALARGGIATLFGFLNPIAALVGLIDVGGAKDQPCDYLVQVVKKRANVKETAITPKKSGQAQ